MRFIYNDPGTLDPATRWVGSYIRAWGIIQTLFYCDEKNNVVPELATGYEALSDTEYKIDLRQGVKFHDGSPFNADAVVFSLNRVLSPENTRHGDYDFIESVSKVSDHEVLIKTKKPYAATIASLTDPIASIISPNTQDFNISVIGTGPFRQEKYNKDISVSVTRFDDFWGGKPYLDGAIFYFVKDPQVRSYKLQNDEIDSLAGYPLPATEVKTVVDNPGLMVVSNESSRLYLLYLNNNKEPFNDPDARMALNYAINRGEIIDTALEGVGGVEPEGFFPRSSYWWYDGFSGYKYDQSKASDLLDGAGIKDADSDGWRDYRGKTLEISLRTYVDYGLDKPAEVIQAQLEAIGIKTNLDLGKYSAEHEKVENGDYNIWLDSWPTFLGGDPHWAISNMFQSNRSEAKLIGYSNSAVDEWLDKAIATNENAKRRELYDKVQEQVLEDAPVIYLYFEMDNTGMNRRVGGYKYYPGTTILTRDLYLNS
jgi:peptide/nickel transport system substrate-binding protein